MYHTRRLTHPTSRHPNGRLKRLHYCCFTATNDAAVFIVCVHVLHLRRTKEHQQKTPESNQSKPNQTKILLFLRFAHMIRYTKYIFAAGEERCSKLRSPDLNGQKTRTQVKKKSCCLRATTTTVLFARYGLPATLPPATAPLRSTKTRNSLSHGIDEPRAIESTPLHRSSPPHDDISLEITYCCTTAIHLPN